MNTGPLSSSPPSDSSPSASPSDSSAATPESFAPGAPNNQCLTANLAVSVDDEDSSVAVAPVTIENGGFAAAQLTIVIIDPGGGQLGDSCVLGHGDGYNITPPHSLPAVPVTANGIPACTNGTAWMTVGPITGRWSGD